MQAKSRFLWGVFWAYTAGVLSQQAEAEVDLWQLQLLLLSTMKS